MASTEPLHRCWFLLFRVLRVASHSFNIKCDQSAEKNNSWFINFKIERNNTTIHEKFRLLSLGIFVLFARPYLAGDVDCSIRPATGVVVVDDIADARHTNKHSLVRKCIGTWRYGWQLRAQFNGIQILDVPDTCMYVLAVGRIFGWRTWTKDFTALSKHHRMEYVRFVVCLLTFRAGFFSVSILSAFWKVKRTPPLIRLNLMSWACREMGPKHTNKHTWQRRQRHSNVLHDISQPIEHSITMIMITLWWQVRARGRGGEKIW